MPVYASGHTLQIVAQSIGQRRLAMHLLSVFAAAAVLLSAVGLYGVMSYFVGLRQKELGIRLAIGASPAISAAWFSRAAHGSRSAASLPGSWPRSVSPAW